MTREFPKKSDRPTIYRFDVDVILGQGGTGTVYRGFDPKADQVVAIKMFRANFFRTKLHVRDLAKTANKFRKFAQPNVVKIYEFINGDEGPCLVLEYVDGPDLKWYIEERPWNLQERLVIAAQICNGLAYIHDKGFVHHDIKPANVLFTRKGQVKLCDFALTSSGGVLAMFDGGLVEQVTPMYVSPEIIKKEKATQSSDMYSLGVLFYLMFVGKVPYEVDNLQQLYHAHLNVTPLHPTTVQPECPQNLGDIIMKLMDRDPSKRFQDCDSLRITMADVGRSRI